MLWLYSHRMTGLVSVVSSARARVCFAVVYCEIE